MTALTAVLFDVDDTLFDRRRAQVEIVSHIMRDLRGVFAGFDEGTVGEAFLKILGLGGAYVGRVTDLYVNLYPAIDAPVQGARPVVERLAARYHLGVVSNGLPDVQYRKLETLGIKHLFGCVVLSGELGVSVDPIFRLRKSWKTIWPVKTPEINAILPKRPRLKTSEVL